MDNKALYLLAEFDDQTQNNLSKCYQVLKKSGFSGKQTKNIPYHFTLGSKNVNDENNLIIEMEKICSETEAVNLRLDHLGIFGLNVLFIEPNMNFELLNLQKKFFDNCGNGYHLWTAHATILIDEPDKILKAIPIITENFQPLDAHIESIGLYEFFPTRFIKRCELIRNK